MIVSNWVGNGSRRRAVSGVLRGFVASLCTRPTKAHQFGKRSAVKREIISRPVPAIVSEDVWTKAQATLRANFLFGARGAKNPYLLRGLARCAILRTHVYWRYWQAPQWQARVLLQVQP